MAEELRGHNIRVSVVCPGSVDTELSPHAGKDPAKMLRSDDVAHAVAMLVTQAPQSFAQRASAAANAETVERWVWGGAREMTATITQPNPFTSVGSRSALLARTTRGRGRPRNTILLLE